MRQASDCVIERSVRTPGAPVGSAKKPPLAIAGKAGRVEVVLQVGLEMMVVGHAVLLAALFVEADPEARVLTVGVCYDHAERRAVAGEGEDQQADQRPVAQTD
jgi:hypothetical protein